MFSGDRSVEEQAGLEAGRGPEVRPTGGSFVRLDGPQSHGDRSLTVAALNRRRNGARRLAVPLLLGMMLPAVFAASPDDTIELGFRQMYNLDFGGAHQTFGSFEVNHPADPLGYVSNAAAYLFGEFDRMRILQSEFFVHDESFTKPKALMPDPLAKQAFLKELETGERLAKDALTKSSNRDLNAMFAWVLTFGLRADYDGLIEKKYFSSISYLKTGRIAAEKLLSLDPNCRDAYVAMGVEAYILGSKPMPVRWILKLTGSNTDLDDGIRKVRLAADGGLYLRPFARLLLAVAALRGKDVNTAAGILEDLSKQFPRNQLYAEELARLKRTGAGAALERQKQTLAPASVVRGGN